MNEKLLKEMFNSILKEKNKEELLQIYHKYIKEAMNIQDINRWATKKTVTDAVLKPKTTASQKVQDALNKEPFSLGDKVWVYNAIDGMKQDVKKGEPVFYKKTGEPKMIENKILKQSKYWSKDEDKYHYIERVYDTAKILSNIINLEDYIPYHKSKQKHL